ncbi:MAG: S53 family peptidase, partial [Acidimicrobiales bacterium]
MTGVAALAALPFLVLMPAAGASPAAPSAPHFVKVNAAPRLPLGAARLGAVRAGAIERGAVVLEPRDEAGLVAFIAAATDEGSPSFHHYLAPGAFARRFGPGRAAISSVVQALRRNGLRVDSVARDGLLVRFSGHASSVERTFRTGLVAYRLADDHLGQATSGAIRLRAGIARVVSSVVGLDDLVSAAPVSLERATLGAARTHAPAIPAQFTHPAGSPTPCADASGAAAAFGGLTDDQIANSYGAFGLYRAGDFGSGQHVAIFELEPFLRSDISTFDSCYFGASAASAMAGRLHTVNVDGGNPTGPGSGEAILDIEDVSAIAPAASIDVYDAPNTTFGSIDEYASIIDTDTDKVVTSSWGLCEQAVQLGEPGTQQAENLLFQQAAAQGQSVFSAAGDTGSDDCNASRPPAPVQPQNPLSIDDPASQPYVVSVGGTTITDAATVPASEQVWNDGANGGAGGGGISMSWPEQAWQQAARVPGIGAIVPSGPDYANANAVEQAFGYSPGFCDASGASPDGSPGGYSPGGSSPCRLVPDVSAQADEYTGAVTIYGDEFKSPGTPDGWVTIGGTSSATPIWASLLALTNASASCAANPATASGVGFVSPLLYAVASNPAEYAASFN